MDYLSYDGRYADLLFEVVSRRYDEGRAIVLIRVSGGTPSAACSLPPLAIAPSIAPPTATTKESLP